MYHTKITNPKTGRVNKVVAWNITPKTFWGDMKSGNLTAKGLSWKLLNDDETIQLMEDTLNNDSSSNNFALSVFENALDWSLGLAVVRYCNAMITVHKKLPKSFTLMVNKKGDVFIKTFSGKLLEM